MRHSCEITGKFNADNNKLSKSKWFKPISLKCFWKDGHFPKQQWVHWKLQVARVWAKKKKKKKNTSIVVCVTYTDIIHSFFP